MEYLIITIYYLITLGTPLILFFGGIFLVVKAIAGMADVYKKQNRNC